MCSELLRIPITFSGVPIFGFGVVLAVWLAIGAWALAATAKVAGWPAALKGHLPTILIVAAIIALFLPRYFPEGVPLRGYGLMVLAGSIAGILMAIHRARQARVAADEIMGLAVVLFICGVVGARLFYIVEYWDSRIRQDDWWATLKDALSYTEGGLVVYGAFVGGMLGFAAYVWRRKLPALAMADLIAPSMMAGLALGRVGCLLNGCCYGGESTAPWAVTFPRENAPRHFSAPYADQAAAGRFYGFRVVDDAEHGAVTIDRVDAGSPAEKAGLHVGEVVLAVNGKDVATADAARDEIIDTLLASKSLRLGVAGGEERAIAAIEAPSRSLPVHPTQIYSAIDAGLLAWLLWAFYPYRRRDGAVIALMITLHPISRFLLEYIRVDESPVFGTGLSISQNLSLALLAVAAGLWIWLLQKPPGRLAFPLPAPKTANPPAG
jgi:phosphatidylglycerol:prolipoprotein diacylglycerol transferase